MKDLTKSQLVKLDNILIKVGLKEKSISRPVEDEIVKLYLNGYKPKEIAKKLNKTITNINSSIYNYKNRKVG